MAELILPTAGGGTAPLSLTAGPVPAPGPR